MEDFLQDPYDEYSASAASHGDNTAKTTPGDASGPHASNGASLANFNSNSANMADFASLSVPSGGQSNATYNTKFGSPQTAAKFDPSSDPLMDQLNFFGSPLQQTTSIDQSLSADIFSDIFDPKYKDAAYDVDPSEVDPLQSEYGQTADNANFSENMFLSSQYFSPNNRGNFSSLNAIAEDGMPMANSMTPNISRHGSVSVQPPHELSNSYLSPKNFMSPQSNAYEGSFDTLTSPYSGSYSGSYLNSPPPMTLNQSVAVSSAPVHAHAQLSVSPQIPQLPVADVQAQLSARRLSDAGSKQLTQEEKIKRRREFHNAVERRRRDLIKEKIKVLGLLVPPSLLTPQFCAVQTLSKPEVEKTAELAEILANIKVKETKPNKAIILRDSIVYIRHLQKVSEQQKKRRQELEAMIQALESESSSSTSSNVFKNEEEFFKEILNG